MDRLTDRARNDLKCVKGPLNTNITTTRQEKQHVGLLKTRLEMHNQFIRMNDIFIENNTKKRGNTGGG